MNNEIVPFMSAEDLNELARAKRNLEMMRFSDSVFALIGKPAEYIIAQLPKKANETLGFAAERAIRSAVDIACCTMWEDEKRADWLHRLIVNFSGAGGGFFGMAGLSAELPFSTCVILRSIAQIAKDHGEDLEDPEVRLSCVEVFALGGPNPSDDAMESAYLVTRLAMQHVLSEAASYVATGASKNIAARQLVRFIELVAKRFSIVVSEKMLVQGLPVIGAVTGAAINDHFISFFQRIAEGHFAVRRLERKYGRELVQSEYRRIPLQIAKSEEPIEENE